LRQDDPKKCTAIKLFKFKLIKLITNPKLIPKLAIVLNPYAKEVLTPVDKKLIERNGLIAVDCSWNKIYETFKKRFKGLNKRLPFLLAANPINYGKLGKLSSAEALASALYIVSCKEEAEKILSLFKWGGAFLALNRNPLKDYSKAKSIEEVLKLEKEYFGDFLKE
jgi:pre-rRNA-processing protein TSR3